MPIKIDQKKCTRCGCCMEVCGVEALKKDGKNVKVDENTCIDCGACMATCENEAISPD